MKNTIFFKISITIILFVSAFFSIYGFVNKELPEVVSYISLPLFFSTLTYLYLIGINSNNIKRLNWLENRLKLWNSISYRVKKAGETSFNKLPIGIVLFDENRIIEWANPYAKEIFLSPLVDRLIEVINPDLFSKLNKSTNFDLVLYGKTYECQVLAEDNILYLIDKTDLNTIEAKYQNRMLCLGVLSLDNLYSAIASLDPQERALQISNLIGVLSEWGNKHNIYLRGYNEEQYLLIMDYSQLKDIIATNFKILEDVKMNSSKVGLRITASIGIACSDIASVDLFELAETQLELAVNRGGNQAVVNINGESTYYGAKTVSVETRSPVYVRVKAETLSDLILNSSKVFIMAHRDMDADAFGACLAASKIVKSLKREARIVFEEGLIDETIEIIYDIIKKEHVNYLDYFITPSEAIDKLTDDTLLLIVDTQYQSLLPSEKLYKKAKKIALIDHHRRNSSAISNYQFLYTQSSASSTVELIVEMYEFLENQIDISSIEATWMLMGVIVDTNNLMYRVSYRTFNVLSILQKYGAEMPKVQRYLRENFDEYVKRMTILNNLELVDNKYGVAICNDDIYPRAFLAKIADNIISVNNIKAAFCIGKIENNEIGISARSLDEVNVQVVMEAFKGGGHFSNAAAQIPNTTIEEVREKLIEQLSKIDEGGSITMKVILTKDVNRKGKKNDIIDIPAGHANFLIRSNQAIIATSDNIGQLESKRQEEKVQEEKHLNEMQELKLVIDKSPITIAVKVGKEGKLFGKVSSKQIIDEFKLQNGINLDKRKMLYEQEISTLGTYEIPIQIHKEVTAKIKLFVVEKK